MIWTPKRDLILPRHLRRKEPGKNLCEVGIVNPYVFAGPGFAVDAADFDGTNDWLQRASAFSGQANSKTGILSAWFKFDTNTTQPEPFMAYAGGDDLFELICSTPDSSHVNFSIAARNVGSTIGIINKATTASYAIAGWLHLLASWDVSTNTFHMYVNNVSDQSGAALSNTTIPYASMTTWTAGAYRAGSSNKMDGGFAELYFAPGQFLDFSNSANRAKFISGGKPVSLGATGSLPTGSAPLIFLHLDDAEAPANFATNRAGAGNYTVNGTLTTYASSPTD